MFGAVIGYEGLITLNPVLVFELVNPPKYYVFHDMDEDIFRTEKLGLSTDGSYYYFISKNKREVEIFIEGIKTAFKVVREIVNS